MNQKRFILTLAITVSFFVAPSATAQCFNELRGGEPASAFTGAATATDALEIFARAVRLYEPALPPFGNANTRLLEGLESNPSAYQSGVYLSERGLLPANFSVENFNAEIWLEMQNRLLGWYDLPTLRNTHDDLSKNKLISDLANISLTLHDFLEPILLVASENRRADTLSFLAMIHLQGPYPRLVILRPLDNIDISRQVQTLLPLLNTCVTDIEKYVYAPQSTANRLFFSNTDAESYIVYSEPHNVGRIAIPIDGELPYFQFQDASLDGVERFSVVFAGSNLGAGAIIRMLPQLRTNLGAGDILGFFN